MNFELNYKNVFLKWCKVNGVKLDNAEMENYKRFLALDGLDHNEQDAASLWLLCP